MLGLILVVVLAQQVPPPGAAPAPRGYVQGSASLTVQPGGTAPEGVEPSLSGKAATLGAAAGRFVTPRLALEGEFVLGGAIAAAQTLTFYSSTHVYRAENRDLLFNANLRWRPRGAGMELVGGGGLAITRARKLDTELTYVYPRRTTVTLPDTSERDYVVNVGAGLDFPVRGTAVVAIVPGLRIRWAHRVDPGLASEMAAGGLSVHVGAAVRGSFDRRAFGSPPSRGPAYLQGGFLVASHPAGTANHRVSPPLGGEAFGASASGGAFVTPAVAIEGEFVAGGIVSAPQRFSYNWGTDYTAEAREILLGGNVRGKPGSGPLELVFGAGVAFVRLAKRDQVTTYTLYPPQPARHEPDYMTDERHPFLGGGVDVPIRLGTRVELVPTFRYRWVPRREETESAYMGVGPHVYQAGATLRVRLGRH